MFNDRLLRSLAGTFLRRESMKMKTVAESWHSRFLKLKYKRLQGFRMLGSNPSGITQEGNRN